MTDTPLRNATGRLVTSLAVKVAFLAASGFALGLIAVLGGSPGLKLLALILALADMVVACEAVIDMTRIKGAIHG